MNTKWFSAAALAAVLAIPAGISVTAHAAALPAASGFYQERPWDQPPDEYRDVQKRGFRDGVEEARRDWSRHTNKDADDHTRFRNPPVPGNMRDDYRDGFRHGYDDAMHHMRDEHHDHD